jgi:hypothetical protein
LGRDLLALINQPRGAPELEYRAWVFKLPYGTRIGYKLADEFASSGEQIAGKIVEVDLWKLCYKTFDTAFVRCSKSAALPPLPC